MPETEAARTEATEQVVFTIPWDEKRKELPAQLANEPMIAQAWNMNEELVFFFLMWLGTY